MNELYFLEEQQVNPLLIREAEKFRAQGPESRPSSRLPMSVWL